MLYCPKCQATYKNGTQRFCTNEGTRLLPHDTSEESGQRSKGVFTSILSKSLPKKEKSFLVESENIKNETMTMSFNPPTRSKFFKLEKDDETNKETDPTVSTTTEPEIEIKQEKSFEHIPLANVINPSLIAEKRSDADKVFRNEPLKINESDQDFSEKSEIENEESIEHLETNNQDFLEIDENKNEDNAENAGAIELSEAEANELPQISLLQNEDDLNLENDKTDSTSTNLDSEIDLDLVGINEASEITESETDFEIDLDEPLETVESFDPNSDIELKLNDLEDSISTSEQLPRIELDLDEIEDVPNSNTYASEPELDLESRKEINLADSIPRIELDLADLNEVSIPVEVKEEELDLEEENLETTDSAELIEESQPEVENEDAEISTAIISPEILTNAEDKVSLEELEPKKEEEIVVTTDDEATAAETSKIKATDDSTWEKRSSEATDSDESKWFLYPLIGLIILGLGLLGFFYLTNSNNSINETQANKQVETLNQSNTNSNANANANVAAFNTNTNDSPPNANADDSSFSPDNSGFQDEPKSQLSDVPPPPRSVRQPPNTVLFKNDKKNQKGTLAEKFLGFSIYYPKDWKETKAKNKFLDISKKTPEGLLIKQLLIERYDSRGTFDADRSIFDELVEKSNNDLRGILSNYEVIFQDEGKFQNNRWRVYEVKFQGIGSDKKLILWGRRLWIPVQRREMKSGFIITMIGTSLSDDVKSVADLGETDDLAEILKTFEPELN